ncbi:MAG: hypothetical protein ABSD74_07970 [Rhizomicrobium sp.]
MTLSAESEIADAERPVEQDVESLKASNPRATDRQLQQLWTYRLVHSGASDAHYAATLHAFYDVREKEGLLNALDSRIVTDSDRQKMDAIVRVYATRHSDYAKLARTPGLLRLVDVMAASKAAMSDSGAQAPTIASLGVNAAAKDSAAIAAAQLTQDAVAADVILTMGSSRVDHLMAEEIRDGDFRKAIMGRAGLTAREASRDIGGGLNDITLGHYVFKKILHVEPEPPPAATVSNSWRDRFLQNGRKAAAATQAILIGAEAPIMDALKNLGRPSGH